MPVANSGKPIDTESTSIPSPVLLPPQAHGISSRHPTETGMARLSLNDADKDIRNWFLSIARSLNYRASVDQMGNLFTIRPGKNASAPPIMMGSHLDTQPTGGRYDGI